MQQSRYLRRNERSVIVDRRNRSTTWPTTLIATMTLVPGSTVWAHHSYTMFDLQRQLTLAGTVKAFEFNNPHCFIQLVVPANDGRPIEWSIEMGAPAHLIRHGWKPSTVKPGDKLKVIVNPLRDGGNGGNYVSATDLDGKPVGEKP